MSKEQSEYTRKSIDMLHPSPGGSRVTQKKEVPKQDVTDSQDGMEILPQLNRKLQQLLDDAHPGLMEWRMSLSHVLLQLSDYAGYGMISEMAKTGYLEKFKQES